MRRLHYIVTALVVVAAVGAVPAPAVADEDDSVFDDLISDDEGDGWLSTAWAYAQGTYADVVEDPEQETASEAAQGIQDEFNAHAASLQAFGNNRTSATESANVLGITTEVDGESTTVYLVADVRSNSYENATIVDETDRTVDESCTLSGEAARAADTELAEFHERFVAGDEQLAQDYYARLAGQYGSNVDCTFIGG